MKKEERLVAVLHGLYEFLWMPFGLNNAPATDGAMPRRPEPRVLSYLHDIIIFSSKFEEHLQRVKQVLKKLEEHGLKRKPHKCHLF